MPGKCPTCGDWRDDGEDCTNSFCAEFPAWDRKTVLAYWLVPTSPAEGDDE